jgi:hypothetical protein
MRKMMIVAALLLSVLPIVAQEDKPNVLVEAFVNKSNASNVACNNLRQEIMAGLTDTERLTIVDASLVSDLPAAKNDRLVALGDMGIQYYIEGTLNSIDTKKTQSTSGGKTTTQYEATINYTLTVIDVASGVIKATETYKDSYLVGATQDEAILKSIEYAKKRMKRFVDENFKVEAVIKALDEVDKKGVKSCYISVGSNLGIIKGQIFEVFSKIEIAGEMIDKKIAELKAEEVLSGTLTKCSVKSGGAEIKSCFEKKIVMKVVTRAKKPGALERLNNALGI